MWNVFVFLIAIGITSFYIVKFLEETWLLEPQKRRLQERFEVWWRAFAGTDAKKLALSLASKISDLVDEYFGRRLFSKRAFVRSFVISTGLLLSSLALTGLLNGRIVGVSPWNAYSETAEALKNIPQPQARTLQTPPDKRSQEIAKKLSEIAAKYGTSGWKIAYSVAFIMSLILLNSLLFFLALVFSRVTLSEIIAAGRSFSTLALLFTNTMVFVPIWIVVLLLILFLSMPMLWMAVPVLYLMFKVSIYWFVWILVTGSLIALAFAGAPVKAVALIGLLPCVFSIFVTATTAIALFFRERFRWIISAFLYRCAKRGPLAVIIGVLTLVAALVAVIGQAIQLIK